MSVNSIKPINFKIISPQIQSKQLISTSEKKDFVTFENPNIDKKPLIKRNIITPEQNINQFFDKIASEIFDNQKDAQYFAAMLKAGAISLSSCAYMDLKNPKSAIGVELNPQKTIIQNLAFLEQYIETGIGVGINFSNFSNPIDTIKKINEYFKYRHNDFIQATEGQNRAPAGIGLLNITHPKILEFISLKDNEDYNDWCFDLSVILDNDFLSKIDNDEYITLDDDSEIPAKTIYQALLTSMYKKGEPGIIFSSDKNYICDPCAAIKLKKDESFVLGHINLARFYNPTYKNTKQIDFKSLTDAAYILSLALKKLDNSPCIGVLGYGDLLDKMNLAYGTKESLNILDKTLAQIHKQTCTMGVKLAISPTSTVSKILKTSPALEHKNKETLNYYTELNTLETAQRYLEGSISKTIYLNKNNSIDDIDKIIRYCAKSNIKGISVFVK